MLALRLGWFRSYLSDRRLSVRLGVLCHPRHLCHIMESLRVVFLGLFYSHYMLLPLGSIFRKYGISFQLYLPLKRKDSNSIAPLLDCLRMLEPGWPHIFKVQ